MVELPKGMVLQKQYRDSGPVRIFSKSPIKQDAFGEKHIYDFAITSIYDVDEHEFHLTFSKTDIEKNFSRGNFLFQYRLYYEFFDVSRLVHLVKVDPEPSGFKRFLTFCKEGISAYVTMDYCTESGKAMHHIYFENEEDAMLLRLTGVL